MTDLKLIKTVKITINPLDPVKIETERHDGNKACYETPTLTGALGIMENLMDTIRRQHKNES